MTLEPPTLRMRDVRIRHLERTEHTPDGVNLEVNRGEVVLVLGPSGCGKSTLALSIDGLVPHVIPADLDGTVEIRGVDTTDSTVAALSERVAMVFQDPDAQIVTGTLLDEVCFGAENTLLPVSDVLARAERSLRAVSLWDRRGDNPDTLSGGGKQRLAIACALAMETELLVLDEPTANLDPAGIDEVYSVLREIAASGARAIVLVEHNLDAAIDVIDRVVVLDAEGHVAFDGDVRDILIGHADEVAALGVWLPVATLAGLRLRDAGLTTTPLPLTVAELTAIVDGIGVLPEPAVTDAAGGAAPHASARGSHELPESTEVRPSAISVRDLTIKRGRTPVLRNVSLDIAAGDFVAVVGTNGAGKTTLVQAIAGVVAPPKGRVSLGGLDPATGDVRALASHIGFVFQNPEHQFIQGTVHDELAHGLRVHGIPGTSGRALGAAWIDARVTGMLARFGLEKHADAHPFLLSGGQKRRLSVGTALITGAPVLVLDEPTFGQDRERANELLELLSGLHRRGTTVIIVTHDMQLVAEHASHVAVLADGELSAFGPAREIMSDRELIENAGLRLPPLVTAMQAVTRHPSLRHVTRLADLPGGPRGSGGGAE